MSSDEVINKEVLKKFENNECIIKLDTYTPVSKRQMKKLKKKQEFESKKTERRKFQKERRKAKRKEQQLKNNDDLGPSKKQLKLNIMENSNCKVKIAIDCSFDHLMPDKDIAKFCQQMQYCYSRNRRAINPLQLYLTSMGNKTMKRLEEIGTYKNWDINIVNDSYIDAFPKDSIIYLSSDSPKSLQNLDENKVYIIGGLVDHNHHKGICYQLAQNNKIDHAHLPIKEYMELSSRNVLTVNHVFEILLNFSENNNWAQAFANVIPKRKINSQKKNQINNSEDSLSETSVNQISISQNSFTKENDIDDNDLKNRNYDNNKNNNNKVFDVGNFEFKDTDINKDNANNEI